MQFLTAEILVFIVTVLDGVENILIHNGDHVCMKNETFMEEYEIKTMKPVEVKKKSWCWSITRFFRCSETVTEWREQIEYKKVPRRRTVLSCCDGYQQALEPYMDRKCVPYCKDRCHGKCIAPDVCECRPGFYGVECTTPCPEEYWGQNCINECKCMNGGICYSVSGCACQPGWMGLRCEIPCLEGFYGLKCSSQCDCGTDPCNHITGECIITSTEPTTTTTAVTTSTTEILPFIAVKEGDDESLIDIAIQSLSTSTTDFATEASTHSTGESTTNESSAAEIFKIPIQIDLDSSTVTGISVTTEAATQKTDATSSEMSTKNVTNVLEVAEVESPGETVSMKSALYTTETSTFIDEITTISTESEKVEAKIKISLLESELNFRGSLDTIINSKVETTSSKIFPGTVNESNIRKNKTSWIGFTTSKDFDKNTTDNFFFEGKENPNKKGAIFKFLHFLPSFSVITAASFLILIIAARWIIVNHRRKTRMLVVVAEKGLQSEERITFQAENTFWVNNCTMIPVYMSDVDLNNTTPILETFKPPNKELKSKESTVL